ncbi:MAG: DNA primase [Actinomycetales bacterium]
MTTDPRAALDRLIAALESHLTASQQRRGDSDPAVARAYDTLADAFDTYDEALFAAYGETTPFDLYDEDDEGGDEEDEDEEDEDDDEDDEDEDEEDDVDEGDFSPDDFDDHVDGELEDSLND